MVIEDCLYIAETVNNFDQDIINLTDSEASIYEECYNSTTEESFDHHVIKFDTACSRNMSGNINRLMESYVNEESITIKGFNGSSSTVDAVGVNEDGKLEYYVKNMPSNLTLLCAQEYAKEGAAVVLFPDNGVVLRLTSDEKESLEKYIKNFQAIKQLKVNKRTYEVINGNIMRQHV